MPNLVVKDNSLGEAIGLLGTAYSNATNPKTQWEAYNLKQRVEHTQMLNQKLAQDAATEAARLEALKQAEEGVAQVAARSVAQMPAEIEQGRVDFNNQNNQNFQGPFQGVLPRVANPGILNADVLRRGQIASLRSGKDPADIARQSLGFGMVVGGVPTNTQDAQLAQTFMTGQLPSVATPLTDDQRRVIAQEIHDRQQKDVLTQGKGQSLIIAADRARALGFPHEGDRPYVIEPKVDPTLVDGPFTGDRGSLLNTLHTYQKVIDSGGTPSQELTRAATIAAHELRRTTTTFTADGPRVTQPGLPPLPAFADPSQPQAGAPLAAPGAVPPGAVPPGAVPPGATPPAPGAAAPGAATPTAASGGMLTKRLPDGTDISWTPGPPSPPPEHIIKKTTRTQMMDASGREIKRMLAAGFKPSLTGEVLGPLGQPGGGSITSAIQTGLMRWAQGQLAPDDQVFTSHVMSFLNEVLRDDSGAAVPETEYPRYIASMMPAFGDTEEQIKAKQFRMDMAVQARRNGLSIDTIAAVALGGNPAMDTINARPPATPPAAPGSTPPAAPAAAPPAPGSPEHVRAREEYDRAVAAINASPAGRAAKAEALREAQRRFDSLTGG